MPSIPGAHQSIFRGPARTRISLYIQPRTIERLDRLAGERRISRSAMVDLLVLVDYAAIWKLFLAGATHADVVLATGLEPAIVRDLHAEFRAGYNPCENVVGVAIANANARAARERRIGQEAKAHARVVETLARDRKSQRSAWVKLGEQQAKKHVAELAETTRLVDRTRTARGER